MSTFKFHAYRDSEAPGVRRAAIGVEPAYDDDELPAALAWASVAQWGAIYVLTRSVATFAAFEAEAEQLGYRLEHVYKGKGEATFRCRVERIAPAAHWSDGLVQSSLLDADAQLAMF